MRSNLLAAGVRRDPGLRCGRSARTGRGNAEARRHADLHDPGGRAAQPGRAPRGHLRRVHAVAPFYSVLMRVNPRESRGHHAFRLRSLHCRSRPPTDDGKTYTFKIRTGRQVPRRHAADRRRRRGKLARDHLPAPRRAERAAELVLGGGLGRGAGCDDRRVQAEIRHRHVPAGARRSVRVHLSRRRSSTRTRTGSRTRAGLRARSSSSATTSASRSRASGIPNYYHKGAALSRRLHRHLRAPSSRCGWTRSAPTARRWSSAACRPRRDQRPEARRSATRSRCRPATGTAAT